MYGELVLGGVKISFAPFWPNTKNVNNITIAEKMYFITRIPISEVFVTI